MRTHRYAQLALAAGIALAAAAPAFAAPAPTLDQKTLAAERVAQGEKPRFHQHGHRNASKHHRGHHGHAMLRSLDLTDEQKDKIFEIRHAAAPELRAAMKQAMQSRQSLRELSRADTFDEARAKELAQAGADAMAQAAVLRAKTENQIYAVLTPEQRGKLTERAERKPRHADRGERKERGERGARGASAAPAAPAQQ